MTTTRMILILTLTLAMAGALSAQPATSSAETPVKTVVETSTAPAEESPSRAIIENVSSHEIRGKFSNLLRNSPTELARTLAVNPSLLSNETFVNDYPELAQFLAAHPEIRRSPRYYLAEFGIPGEGENVVEEIFEMLGVVAIFALIAFALSWLLRTIIESKRWNRLSRIQTEVHNKILDRFSTSAELLEYIRSSAGTKFLESAPIPLHTEQARVNPPMNRVMWSIQIGVIMAVAGLGVLVVSSRFEKEAAQGLFAMGMIALSIGAGFIVSAAVSLFLSRRLGLWVPPQASETTAADRFESTRQVR